MSGRDSEVVRFGGLTYDEFVSQAYAEIFPERKNDPPLTPPPVARKHRLRRTRSS